MFYDLVLIECTTKDQRYTLEGFCCCGGVGFSNSCNLLLDTFGWWKYCESFNWKEFPHIGQYILMIVCSKSSLKLQKWDQLLKACQNQIPSKWWYFLMLHHSYRAISLELLQIDKFSLMAHFEIGDLISSTFGEHLYGYYYSERGCKGTQTRCILRFTNYCCVFLLLKCPFCFPKKIMSTF